MGITGGIGGLLAEELRSRGDTVHGLARRDDQQADLAARGVNARVGDLADMTVEQLAAAFADVDAMVFSAGSNGGSREVTTIREPAPCLSGRRSSMGRSLAKTSPYPRRTAPRAPDRSSDPRTQHRVDTHRGGGPCERPFLNYALALDFGSRTE
ncbi:NAD(P)H-binding protein [Streptomyces scopuliridis]|uniref:NAD(P)H-binding protein n=1 Tax=Streptomyces scopuliridis TaxID=452529 RepID=UPI00369E9446